MLKLLLRHNVIIILFLFIFLPIILIIYMNVSNHKHLYKWIASDYRLYGVTEQIKPPKKYNLKAFKSHRLQKYVEESAAKKLPLRSWLIRTSNQVYYSIFKTSFAYNNNIIIGNDNNLFERYYIYTYCGLVENRYNDTAKLVTWANKLKELNDYFKNQGKLFIYLITPNKAEYMPENIPHRYHCKSRGISTHIKELEHLLDERQILYVNAADLMQTATQQYKTSMFPKGGTHWNHLGAITAANALIDAINQNSRTHLDPIQFNYELTKKPHGTDHDLASLLNLMKPNKNYIVPQLTFNHFLPPKNTVTVSFIGGSFTHQLLELFHRNDTFSSIRSYFYLIQGEKDYEPAKPVQSHPIGSFENVIADIVSSDIILLEENTTFTISNHAQLFYDKMKQYAIHKTG